MAQLYQDLQAGVEASRDGGELISYFFFPVHQRTCQPLVFHIIWGREWSRCLLKRFMLPSVQFPREVAMCLAGLEASKRIKNATFLKTLMQNLYLPS